ncbi:MAG: GNAT family N-acetyltransferase [Pseudomonadota bacterium]
MSKKKTISDLKIRLLTADDIPAYAAHLIRNLKTSGLDDTPIFTIRSRTSVIDGEELAKTLTVAMGKNTEPGWEKIWAAWDGNLLVGDVALMSDRYAPSQMHRVMLGMEIELDYRHMGLGKRLMREVIDWAKAQAFLKWIDLGVFSDNAPARRLYESSGFIECGRTVDAFRVDGHSLDDIQMVLDLDQLR